MKNFLRSKKELLRLFVGVSTVMILFLAGNVKAQEHPFLLVTEDMYPELQARANSSPWSDMKAEAISFINNNSYDNSDNATDKHYMIRNLSMCGALAYIVDPANKIFYKNKTRDALLNWDDAITSVNNELTGHSAEVYPGSSFVSSVVAFDIIYNDLTATERNTITNMLNSVYNEIGGGWTLNREGVKGVWNVFLDNESQALIHINNYKNAINSQVSTDGVGAMGPGYSLSRLGGSSGRGPSKAYSADIFDFTGYENFYDNSRLTKFYEWLIVGGVSPIKMTTMFGDSLLKDAGNRATARFYSLNHFSSKAHRQAAWLLKDANKDFFLEQILFHYILQDQQMPVPEKPKSAIWTNGGAAFWEDNSSDRSMQGVLWNVKVGQSHSHRDVNSIHITAYGENVLRNVGYEGWGSGIDGTFGWNWIHDQAKANNVALINNDATGDKKGNGITEGFIGGLFDYASGDGGNCMPLSRGHHQRNFIMVHPQDGKPGYFALIDEINVKDTNHKGHILFHPDSANYATVSANTEYKWTINRHSAHNVYLNIFLATPPSSVSVLNGGLTNPPYVGKYLDSRYVSDPSGDVSALTVLFPSDSTHAKAAMSRIAGLGYTGAKIDHGGDIIDYALESDNASAITHNGVSFQGLAALYRMNNDNNSFYFVRKGRSLDDGKAQRRGFESDANVTIYIKDKQGKIISSGANVTFYYPGITDVAIDGVSAPIINSGAGWVKINIGTGNHDVLLLTDGEIPPTDNTDPIVDSFTANPTIVNTNDTITFSYTVTDETALGRVELYRTTDKSGSPDPDNWSWIKTDDTISGTSVSGSFTDSISIAGIYWYGMHVVDEAGNRGYEPSPVKVVVNSVSSSCVNEIYVAAPVAAATINFAIALAQPGDCVIIPDGTYASLGQIKIPSAVNGTEVNPIILKAATPGGVTFTGNSASPLIFVQGDWWVIRDFKFIDVSEVGDAHTYGIKSTNATGTRITNTYWEGFGTQTDIGKRNWCIWWGLGGTGNYSRVDHNTFSKNKAVCTVHSPESKYCKVDHNYFKDSLGDGTNGFEGIHNESSNLIAEYNLFENMWADPETISNKGPNNTYRYNVFKSTGGSESKSLVLRGGDNCIVEGNYFFNTSTFGIRVHGAGHKIINNYFENNNYGAILLAEGGVNHANVSNILIANNTIVNTIYRGIDIGWWPGGDVKPNNLTFKNNIIISDVAGSYLIRDGGHTGTFVWKNNLHYVTGSANYWLNNGGGGEPGTGITHANPNLTTGYGIYRLQASSTNAIEKGTPVAGITDDIDGHLRDATSPDIGCDEYSASAPARLPITEDEVGVSWLMPFPPADTCQTEGYQCCNSCQSGSHSEYNGNCPGQVCCEVCTPGAIIPPSCSDSGTCCATGWICDGGSGENLPGCSNVCCIGGTCVPAPALPPTCQSEGYKCCASCQSGPHSEYDTDCTSGQICCETCPPPPKTEMDNFISALDFPKLVQNFLSLALSIIGSLALLMLIIGGVMYMGSTGDEQKALTAKKIVTYAILGIVLILLSYSITMVLSGILS